MAAPDTLTPERPGQSAAAMETMRALCGGFHVNAVGEAPCQRPNAAINGAVGRGSHQWSFSLTAEPTQGTPWPRGLWAPVNGEGTPLLSLCSAKSSRPTDRPLLMAPDQGVSLQHLQSSRYRTCHLTSQRQENGAS
ncbi:hypothetical protein AAFF_G00096700 [Aldrovandia affinis]|uniref:Uncharacterized protein n=1 Tax=Aldrovandia affinis TaxID=143900 RepID=A0AAD7WCN1_9TELE|nr:hypothetical protein AAFF_G00096700 [Aldrovandia affinis]